MNQYFYKHIFIIKNSNNTINDIATLCTEKVREKQSKISNKKFAKQLFSGLKLWLWYALTGLYHEGGSPWKSKSRIFCAKFNTSIGHILDSDTGAEENPAGR